MKKLWRLYIVAILAFGALAVPVSVMAGTQNAPCAPEITHRAHFYENTIADNSDGDDSLWLCTPGNANMANISHTLPGYCHGFFYHNDWGDCVSSAAFKIPSGYAVCLYNDPNYSGAGMRFNSSASGHQINLLSGVRDEVHSYKYIYSQFSC